MLATYRSYGACWTELGAVCWQPTSLAGLVGPSLRLYVGNLQVLWGLVGPSSGLYAGNLQVLWLVGPSLGLYVGNLQVLWGLLGQLGAVCWQPTCPLGLVCMFATYRSYGACWALLGAVCWQPTCHMGLVGPSLGLYVGNLQVLWGLLDPVGAVCWQSTGLVGLVGPSLGLYVGNLKVLWGLLDPAWGCMLATYMSYATSPSWVQQAP